MEKLGYKLGITTPPILGPRQELAIHILICLIKKSRIPNPSVPAQVTFREAQSGHRHRCFREKTYIRLMEKVLKITTIHENTSDYAYWSTKSFQERLEAIEILRQQYFSLNKDVQPRLQRFCSIVKRA